jgi:hypothetical protein
MAITFRGTVLTPIKIGNSNTTQNLFVFENGISSRVNVNIRRLSLQLDSIVAYTAVQPLVKLSRISSASNGVFLSKENDFDTSQSSDPGVRIRGALLDGPSISATEGTTIWQQYCFRMHTLVGQVLGDDRNILTALVDDTGKEFKIRPGEMVLIQVVSAAAAANAINMTNWIINCAWEEDEITTFAISGVVSLNSTPIVGAKVIVVEARDHTLTDAILREVVTTTSGGAWSSTIRTGWVGGAFVQYDNSGTLYTAPGSPFLEE